MAAVSSGGSVCCLPDCPARPLPAHLLLCAPTAVPTTLRSKRPATLPAPLRTAAQHAPVHWWSLWWRLSQKRATRRARLVGRGTHCSYSTQHIHLSVSGGSNPPSPYDPSPATPTLAIPPPRRCSFPPAGGHRYPLSIRCDAGPHQLPGRPAPSHHHCRPGHQRPGRPGDLPHPHLPRPAGC